MNFKEFAAGRRNFIVAPAGYGKTYTIVKTLQETTGRQLVLTHTHAGIASLKKSLQKDKADTKRFSIQTITGFAQQYSGAFCEPKNIPNQGDDGYFDTVVDLAIDVLTLPLVRTIITSSYSGLFVDEYQDCSIRMHELIMVLAGDLPTHVLGDPLQGIFEFRSKGNPRGNLVELKSELLKEGFSEHSKLDTPHRWNSVGNKELGNTVKYLRTQLTELKPINIQSLNDEEKGVLVRICNEEDLYQKKSDYQKAIDQEICLSLQESNPSFLLIPPNGHRALIASRSKIKARVSCLRKVSLIEALDDKDFYRISKEIDCLMAFFGEENSFRRELRKILGSFFASTIQKKKESTNNYHKRCIGYWIGVGGNQTKRSLSESPLHANQLKGLWEEVCNARTAVTLEKIVSFGRQDLKWVSRRQGLCDTLLKAIQESIPAGKSVYETMVQLRNRIRRSGRRIEGLYFGSTLLTKGLEFDTVVILDADSFTCPKHFYVAVSRACKRLVIFSRDPAITFPSSSKEKVKNDKADVKPSKDFRKSTNEKRDHDGQYMLSLIEEGKPNKKP